MPPDSSAFEAPGQGPIIAEWCPSQQFYFSDIGFALNDKMNNLVIDIMEFMSVIMSLFYLFITSLYVLVHQYFHPLRI